MYHNFMRNFKVAVIGAGLAGCEASHLLLKNGFIVDLYDKKPETYTEAHKLPGFAELVCSNSLKSTGESSPTGMLKYELSALDSIIITTAYECRVPAGESLSVDRKQLSERVTDKLRSFSNLKVFVMDVACLPEGYDFYVIATGPLTSPAFANYIAALIGSDFLYFYDAIAPIIDAESIDMTKVFKGSRYGKGGDDYINIPLNKEQYFTFLEELRKGEKVVLRPFEKEIFYEGCLPIEVLASRGDDTLAYGPMKPVGFSAVQAGFDPYAVIQLRREDAEGTSYNMVGFQTKLTFAEQERIFRILPGLENSVFMRYGSIHRNTYVDAPEALTSVLSLKNNPSVYLAGQITGVEGYVESAAAGLLAGLFLLYKSKNMEPSVPSRKTALGALLSHLQDAKRPFQPSGIHLGLFEKSGLTRKKDKKQFVFEQERKEFKEWMDGFSLLFHHVP
jgi:methylenetetrahydrofolate--tRNA-(uracil-5-)-methyltransferase